MTFACVHYAPSAGWTPEELAREAQWQAGVQQSSQRFRELRKCWYCYATWDASGACPNKCRRAGSGFEFSTPGTFPAVPCVQCGEPTSGRAITGVRLGQRKWVEGEFHLERMAWCPTHRE